MEERECGSCPHWPASRTWAEEAENICNFVWDQNVVTFAAQCQRRGRRGTSEVQASNFQCLVLCRMLPPPCVKTVCKLIKMSLICIVRACSYPAHVHRRLLFEDLCKKNLPAVSSSLQSEELALVSVATECFQFCFLLKLAATIISIGLGGKSFLLSQELPAPLSCG